MAPTMRSPRFGGTLKGSRSRAYDVAVSTLQSHQYDLVANPPGLITTAAIGGAWGVLWPLRTLQG
ncbi:hypothetical protein [Streptomyces decoyicus]|uniref:hypothetical protein n=1 Tax=Streptomyces decoyicus TaxID=249567 RepID=UPI0033A5EDFE